MMVLGLTGPTGAGKGAVSAAFDQLYGIPSIDTDRVYHDLLVPPSACLDGMEAPDECGHHGDTEHKIYSIEQIDKKVVQPIIEGLKADGEDFAMLVCPDHPTPLSIMTHCADPIPYIIYRSNREMLNKVSGYDEEQAESTGVFVENGFELMQKLING